MAEPGGVLALDLAGTAGWCYGDVDDIVPLFGIWRLPKVGGEGARYAAFENTLIDHLNEWRPSWIVLEEALPPVAQTNTFSAYQQYTLRGITLAEAYRASIPWSSVSAQLARLEVLGRARPDDKKEAVMAWCRHRGWLVHDHNAADACVVWEWHRRKLRRGANGHTGARP